MEVEIDLAVLAGNIARQIGDFHLLLEGLVHIFHGFRVEVAENGLVDGAEAVYGTRIDAFLFAEGFQGGGDFHMVVEAQHIAAATDFFICIHTLLQ